MLVDVSGCYVVFVLLPLRIYVMVSNPRCGCEGKPSGRINEESGLCQMQMSVLCMRSVDAQCVCA